jgi:predicted flap endonuclease-1-like 5' DNA nuclease/cell division protein FtsB
MFQQNITLGPGTGTFTQHTFEILTMLLGAFLLGLWLGWILWAKYKQIAERLQTDKDSLQASLSALNIEIHTLRDRFAYVDRERESLALRVQNLDNENNQLRTEVVDTQEDLDEVALRNRQLETELALTEAESNPATIEIIDTPLEVVTTAAAVTDAAVTNRDVEMPPAPPTDDTATPGEVTIHSPVSTGTIIVEPVDTDDERPFNFVMQDDPGGLENTSAARTVAAPDALAALDDDHFSDDAFEALTRSAVPAPVEKTELGALVLTPLTQDDLKVVEGIGPKIEELLFKAGIHTYSELAAAPVSRLREILAEAGPRFAMHDPGTWSAQALLAANGEWDNLKAYQNFLDAGKRPDAKG